MPAAVPVVYRALLGFFILLFGGAYAWVASQSRIDRTIVALAAIGKAGAFAIVLILWLAGESTLRGVLAATGDLAFALVFAHWVVFTSANGAD